ncbi:MAG: hypothetical protein HQL21_08075 [Candidatus Omnitrophica bacterium]|nr:hypothetical protein [Candidatus Omnitrophota bacterium]
MMAVVVIERKEKEMKNKLIIVMAVLLMAAPLVSCKQSNRGSKSKVTASEKARFNHNRDEFNNKENKEIRAEELADKEAAETKKKVDEAQDKGEGQVNIKF